MSDLRQRLHAAAASPRAELDTEVLAARSVRRRQRRAIAMTSAAIVVVLAAGGGVLAARDDGHIDTLKTRGSGNETTTVAPSTSEPSTSTSSSSPTSTPSGSTPPVVQPVRATPITGLRNFDSVTITASGLPNGSYYAGQCPATVRATGDFLDCTLDAIVAVDDGRLTATVRAWWWMDSGMIECGAAPGTCIAGLRNSDPSSPFAPVTFDLAFDPAQRPALAVTPSTGLVDGQTIEVRGINVGAGTVSIAQCLVDHWDSCQYHDATAGVDGNFRVTFPIERVLHWWSHGTLEQQGECGVESDCIITAWITPNGAEPNVENRMPIEPARLVAIAFAPASPTTSTTP